MTAEQAFDAISRSGLAAGYFNGSQPLVACDQDLVADILRGLIEADGQEVLDDEKVDVAELVPQVLVGDPVADYDDLFDHFSVV